MINLKIYGTGTSGHELVKATIEEYLNKADIQYQLEDVSDVSQFMKDSISSVPAVLINGKELYELKKNGNFNSSLRTLVQKLLRSENYGVMKKIIVPTDFSETSINAFSYAMGMARDMDAVIKVVHVYYPSSADINGNVFVDVSLRNMKEKLLDEFVDSANQDWIGEVMVTSLIDKQFAEGFPVPKIIDIANVDEASFIVLGSTGEGASFKKLFGSVSTEIVKRADLPVLVVPPHVKYAKIQNVLYASADPDLDSKCMDDICEFCSSYESNIHVVHVEEGEKDALDYSLLDMLDDKYPRSKIACENIVGDDVVHGINSYVKENKIDLLIMSSKKRNFLENLFHSSKSKEMLLHTSIPLLVIHK